MALRTTRSSTCTGSGAYQSAIGRAFSVDDGLLALRWAEIVRPRGYRLTFSHSFIEADEAIEIHQGTKRRALATIFLGVHWVWIVDYAGRTTPHVDVAAALSFLVELAEEERQMFFAPHTPSWLWQARSMKPTSGAGVHNSFGFHSETLSAIFKRICRLGHRRPGRA